MMVHSFASGITRGREFCKVKTCKDGSNGLGCRRRNIHYLLQCDICSAKLKLKDERSKHEATEDAGDDKEDEAVAQWTLELRCEESNVDCRHFHPPHPPFLLHHHLAH